MPQFQFRLATLLRLRVLARDERRAQFAEVGRLIDQVRDRGAEIEALLHDMRTAAAPQAGLLDADRLLNATRYELVLRAEQQSLQAQAQALTIELEKRRQALVAADREVRSLELLRDKQRERHRLQEDDRARKELDEIALRRHAGEEAP